MGNILKRLRELSGSSTIPPVDRNALRSAGDLIELQAERIAGLKSDNDYLSRDLAACRETLRTTGTAAEGKLRREVEELRAKIAELEAEIESRDNTAWEKSES